MSKRETIFGTSLLLLYTSKTFKLTKKKNVHIIYVYSLYITEFFFEVSKIKKNISNENIVINHQI